MQGDDRSAEPGYPTPRRRMRRIGRVDTEWTADAHCFGVDPDLFFSESEAHMATAKSICASCPVRFVCLEGALQRRDRYGIWGGLTPDERTRLQRAG